MRVQTTTSRSSAQDFALALIEFSPTPLLLLNDDLMIVAASTSFCRDFRIDEAGLLGSPLEELADGAWNERSLLFLLKAAAHGHAEVKDYQFDLVRKGRVTRHLVLQARRLPAGDRKILALCARDITATRNTEQLQEDLALERDAMRREHSERVANSLKTVTGILTQTARTISSQEARAQLLEAHEKLAAAAAPRKSSALLDIEAGLRQEIEEQKGALAAARADRATAMQTVEAREALLSMTSHELRTPLNAILGFSEILTKEMFGPLANNRYRDYAKFIHGSGLHLLNLVNDLLDISKYDAGKLELNFGRVELFKLIIDCIRSVETQASKSHVGISVNVYDSVDCLLGDDRRLHQILLNLLSNAIKFTCEGGEISVCAFRRGDLIGVSVSDTGIGIRADDLPKVFEPFSQVGGSLRYNAEGSGLGMPLTKVLTELHGGSLSIESAEGFGTTVTVLFPSAPEEKKISRFIRSEPDGPALRNVA